MDDISFAIREDVDSSDEIKMIEKSIIDEEALEIFRAWTRQLAL